MGLRVNYCIEQGTPDGGLAGVQDNHLLPVLLIMDKFFSNDQLSRHNAQRFVVKYRNAFIIASLCRKKGKRENDRLL